MAAENEIETPPVDASTEAPKDEPKAAEPTALDALNAALDKETPKPDVAEDGDAAEEDAEDKAEKPAKAKVEGEPKADPAKPDPAKPDEPKPDAKPMDPVNDPIPSGTHPKTRERMTALISNVKEVSAERDRYQGERDEIVGMIQATKATPEQYGGALDYLRAVNSGDPAQIREAIKTVQAELRALAGMIGEPVPGIDMLEGHADLKAALEAEQITEKHAQEIAAARALRAAQAQGGARLAEQTQATNAINRGKADLNTLEVTLRATDPQYEAKRALLVPVLQPVLAQLPPAQWGAAFKEAYTRLALPPIAASAAAPVPRPANQGQPLRARQPAGQAAKEPTSALEALNAGIERASGR